VNGETVRVSVANDAAQANSASHSARLSATGLAVMFMSHASNLERNDATPAVFHDWYTRDLSGAPPGDADRDGVPDACACPADLNAYGNVDAADLASLLAAWGSW
jgi:hypothetical protein